MGISVADRLKLQAIYAPRKYRQMASVPKAEYAYAPYDTRQRVEPCPFSDDREQQRRIAVRVFLHTHPMPVGHTGSTQRVQGTV
jgi:hypothetical protein